MVQSNSPGTHVKGAHIHTHKHTCYRINSPPGVTEHHADTCIPARGSLTTLSQPVKPSWPSCGRVLHCAVAPETRPVEAGAVRGGVQCRQDLMTGYRNQLRYPNPFAKMYPIAHCNEEVKVVHNVASKDYLSA